MVELAEHKLGSCNAGRVQSARPIERALKITVLAGGPSSEREVSLKSGRAVADALKSLGHQVTLADIRPDDLHALDIPADLVFIALHGSFGEDGRVQRLLEERGIRYTGSGPGASALAINKATAKRRFRDASLPTPAFEVINSAGVDVALKAWSPDELHHPVVVKPISEGSSIACTIARTREPFERALREVCDAYGEAMVESFVSGIELTVGVLGDAALPPIQIRTNQQFYNYEAKYFDNDTQYLFDIDLPEELLGRIRRMSIDAHRSLGCRDFSRVDWMVDSTTREPYVLEVNTIPGFTDHSLLPKAAQRAGLSFAELCHHIIAGTLDRSG
jgi:D-alanine-D-alanine ligase